MCLGIVSKPSDYFGKLSRRRLQVTFKPRIITTRAKLVAQISEESCGKPEKICTTKSVIQRDDLMDMALYRFEKLGTINPGVTFSIKCFLKRFQIAILFIVSFRLADQQGELSLNPIRRTFKRGVKNFLYRRTRGYPRIPAPIGDRTGVDA